MWYNPPLIFRSKSLNSEFQKHLLTLLVTRQNRREAINFVRSDTTRSLIGPVPLFFLSHIISTFITFSANFSANCTVEPLNHWQHVEQETTLVMAFSPHHMLLLFPHLYFTRSFDHHLSKSISLWGSNSCLPKWNL